MSTHSWVKSSAMVRQRSLRPLASASDTKSMLHASLGANAGSSGCRSAVGNFALRRLRTASLASRDSPHDLLGPGFPHVNHKGVYRLYREAKLAVRKRRKAKFPTALRQPLEPAFAPNEAWSMDFVSDALASGRKLRCLTIADDFTHECVDIAVDHGIGGLYVTRILDQAACFRGYPKAVRTDNVLTVESSSDTRVHAA